MLWPINHHFITGRGRGRGKGRGQDRGRGGQRGTRAKTRTLDTLWMTASAGQDASRSKCLHFLGHYVLIIGLFRQRCKNDYFIILMNGCLY